MLYLRNASRNETKYLEVTLDSRCGNYLDQRISQVKTTPARAQCVLQKEQTVTEHYSYTR